MALSLLLIPLAYFLLAGLGVNLAYHRLLSHRSLTLPKWLERSFVLLGLPAGTPVQWVGNHRYHHAHADSPLDPHSPIQRGFWYAHVGWYLRSNSVWLYAAYAIAGPFRMLVDAWMRPRTNLEHDALAKDVAADGWYAFLSRPWPYAIAMHLLAAVSIVATVLPWGAPGFICLWLTLAIAYNLGDSIDSVSHLYGATLPRQRDASRNNRWLGILVLGEGWHANHHRYPRSAKHGMLAGQFDWTWQVIRMLRALGLATAIQLIDPAISKDEACR